MATAHALFCSHSGAVTVSWDPMHLVLPQDTRSLQFCRRPSGHRDLTGAAYGRNLVTRNLGMIQEIVCLANSQSGLHVVAGFPERSGSGTSAKWQVWRRSRRHPFGCGASMRGKVCAHATSRGNLANELSLDSEVAPAGGNGSPNGGIETDQKGNLYISGEGGILVSGYGWVAREVDMNDVQELRVVADIQATAFHTPAAAFDDLFFDFFKAEVLSALIYRARVSPANRYACIVAESVTDPSLGERPVIVGAVDVTAYGDRRVLEHLPDVEEYLYVSGMAVYAQYRRQGVATLLLQACDMRAIEWKFKYLVLHAYEDDMAARSLYTRAGYEVIASDPMWMSSWVGRRRRVLMAKRCPGTSIPF